MNSTYLLVQCVSFAARIRDGRTMEINWCFKVGWLDGSVSYIYGAGIFNALQKIGRQYCEIAWYDFCPAKSEGKIEWNRPICSHLATWSAIRNERKEPKHNEYRN